LQVSVSTAWLPLLSALVVLLVAVSTLERPIKQTLRARWPAFDYDGQLMLAVGVAALGALTMLLLFLLALDRP
jgi:hypothetical protein